MAANEVVIKVRGDTASAERGLRRVSDRLHSMGRRLTILGGAGLAAFGAMTKSALDQEIGINRLDTALKRLNTSYGAQRDTIEGVVESLQRKTNFGDEAQREALTKLIELSGDYESSLKALPVLLDVATSLTGDLSSATTLMGRGLAGSTELFTRYGIQIEKGTKPAELLAILTEKFGGSAEAAANPVTQLKNRVGDLFQAIAGGLVPIVEDASVALEKVTRHFTQWAEANPGLAKALGIVGAALAAMTLTVGLLGLALPPVITGVGLATGAFGALGGALSLTTVQVAAVAAAAIAVGAAIVGVVNGIKNLIDGGHRAVNPLKILKQTLDAAADAAADFANKLVGSDGLTDALDTTADSFDAMAATMEEKQAHLRASLLEKGFSPEDVEKAVGLAVWKEVPPTLEEAAEALEKFSAKLGSAVHDAQTDMLAYKRGLQDVIDVGGRAATKSDFINWTRRAGRAIHDAVTEPLAYKRGLQDVIDVQADLRGETHEFNVVNEQGINVWQRAARAIGDVETQTHEKIEADKAAADAAEEAAKRAAEFADFEFRAKLGAAKAWERVEKERVAESKRLAREEADARLAEIDRINTALGIIRDRMNEVLKVRERTRARGRLSEALTPEEALTSLLDVGRLRAQILQRNAPELRRAGGLGAFQVPPQIARLLGISGGAGTFADVLRQLVRSSSGFLAGISDTLRERLAVLVEVFNRLNPGRSNLEPVGGFATGGGIMPGLGSGTTIVFNGDVYGMDDFEGRVTEAVVAAKAAGASV